MTEDNRKYDPISYQGPSQTYRTGLSSNAPSETSSSGFTGEFGVGIHDINYVKNTFALMKEKIATLYKDLEFELSKYSLLINPDDKVFISAYEASFPESERKKFSNTLHFDMYKSLLKENSNNAKNYLRKKYESEIRSVNGTNCFDILKLIVLIYSEMTRMEEFLDGFIGEVDDTSEYRVIEAFQSWAEDAYDTVKKLREAFENKKTARLSNSELDSLDQSKAAGIQALFKIKLNVLNKSIRTSFSEIEREYDLSGDVFYNKYLGPSLRFRIKVSRDLANGLDSPVLSREVANTVASLDSTFAVHLADLFKRGMNFQKHCLDILGSLAMRDTYVIYINQLMSKGKLIANTFSNVPILEYELSYFGSIDLLSDFRQLADFNDNFTKSHFELSDLDSDEAHPQYLLRSGGILTGDVTLEDGVKFGGIVPKTHKHNGSDGSAKISGADIELNSITTESISTVSSSTGIPYNLSIEGQNSEISPIGVATVTVQMGFMIDDETTAGYEFEITKLS